MKTSLKLRVLICVSVMSGCVDPDQPGSVAAAIGPPPGPVVTVTQRTDGLAVSWAADPSASQYQVFQSASGSAPALVATMFDSSGGAPATSWIATGLTGGVQYCYAIRSVLADGTASDPGAAACSPATSSGAGVTITIPLPASTARVGGTSPAAALQSGVTAWLVQSTGELVYPLPVVVGDTITGFRVWGNKQSGTATRLAATLMTVASAGGSASGSATASNQLSAPGAFTLVVTDASVVVAPNSSYIIEADSTTGVAQDLWLGAEVTVSRPRM